ncbi:DUF3885 domain-containing protein [Prosthecodimorpha staleyi]|uniref:DUF3885 domain-containing protein n=1 Tax=Prosthecodimorpha staleyi TaxID=2840188 RepID=A0A947D505_9HYPH|nr:hypothetical protein [Prosthecodimorpha staleyi]MBT9291148.1 hypothetical protein [Prosthecodimorpha staleyi]
MPATSTMHDFSQAWRHWHGDRKPVGFMMRWAEAPHWLRIHSLPESRRYPADAADRAELLRRQNDIAGDLLGEEGAAFLVQSFWEAPDGWQPDSVVAGREAAASRWGLSVAFDFTVDEDPDQPIRWTVMARPITWQSGAFDPLLLLVAEGDMAPTLFMSAENGAVFAPYDGGADLFWPDAGAQAAARERYRPWLSAHPHGL